MRINKIERKKINGKYKYFINDEEIENLTMVIFGSQCTPPCQYIKLQLEKEDVEVIGLG